jgi:GT2 family glycosyltransferase
MDVSCIIVNYNCGQLIADTVASIVNAGDGLSKEIIVVDNGSIDGSLENIASKFPDVMIIHNTSNLGFARANNIGIKSSMGGNVLLLNPDTEIIGDALKKMADFLATHPDAGVVGPKLLYPDGMLQLSSRTFYNLRTIILLRTFLGKIFRGSKLLSRHMMSEWDHDSVRKVDWMLAACLMFPRTVLEKTGLLNEAYKLYFEDVDICYRISQKGFGAYYLPEAVVIHHHQRESAKKISRKLFWHLQSMIMFFNEHGWKW